MNTYKVQRLFHKSERRVTLATGLTLAEAQAMCSRSDPENTSTTCRTPANRRRTKQYGPWFNSYTHD